MEVRFIVQFESPGMQRAFDTNAGRTSELRLFLAVRQIQVTLHAKYGIPVNHQVGTRKAAAYIHLSLLHRNLAFNVEVGHGSERGLPYVEVLFREHDFPAVVEYVNVDKVFGFHNELSAVHDIDISGTGLVIAFQHQRTVHENVPVHFSPKPIINLFFAGLNVHIIA